MRRPAPLAALVLLVVALASVASGCGGGEETTSSAEPEQGATVFGFNEARAQEAAESGLLGDSGAGFVRVALNWATVEPVEGQRNFAPYDAINAALEAAGLKPLWVVTSAPCWAAGTECVEQVPNLAPDPGQVDAFGEFTAEVAERYPEALGIEVWNEPNIPNFWKPAPDPELYREALAAAAEAVDEAGSDVPVLMAGPSPTTPDVAAEDPTKLEFTQFIRDVMSGPDAPAVDAIALHPYSLFQEGDAVDESIELYEQGVATAEEVAPGVPIWVTEIGLTTEGQYAITPDEQAAGLGAIVGRLADDGVPVIAIHRFFDQPDSPLMFERGFGVVDGAGAPKPSFCAPADALGVTCEPR